MTTYEIPVSHLVPGTAILVDGESIVAIVIHVEGDMVECDCGTLYGATTVTAVVADDDDVCSECNGEGVVYDASYGCDCTCGSCYDGDADTFEAALWRATAPRPR